MAIRSIGDSSTLVSALTDPESYEKQKLLLRRDDCWVQENLRNLDGSQLHISAEPQSNPESFRRFSEVVQRYLPLLEHNRASQPHFPTSGSWISRAKEPGMEDVTRFGDQNPQGSS